MTGWDATTMMTPQLVDLVLLIGVSLVTAILAVVWLGPGRQRRPEPLLGDAAVWLFAGHELLDLSDRARLLFDGQTDRPDWDSLCAWLSQQFPDLPRDQARIRDSQRIDIAAGAPGDPSCLTCEWLNGVIRLHLSETTQPQSGGNGLLVAQRRELAALRCAVDKSPYPIWTLTKTGEVAWANSAYTRLAGDSAAPLFNLPRGPQTGRKRLPLAREGEDNRHWFDVSMVPDASGMLCYAVDVDAVVQAEEAQRQFVQTLAKTFAQLSIGLAIFDRHRQLALFNPALVDLTALPADFLTARPNMLSFFDRLRDQNMMPEPKNYNSWRHQMADLVAAAKDGRYHETWSLPSGAVYSVSGRPHPDGTIAFLFEDITAEITLTRRFRADLELGQSILDRLEQGVAVFAADGSLTVTNAAYRDLWATDPEKSFAQLSVIDATRCWQARCKASPLWGEIRDFVATRENRTDWWAEIFLTSGEPITCRIMPLQKGATLVSFHRHPKPLAAEREGRAATADAMP